MKGYRLWVIASLAFFTNGASLLGIGQGSVGALARAIEANHNIAHNIERANTLGLMAGNPPVKVSAADFLGPFEVDCIWRSACAKRLVGRLTPVRLLLHDRGEELGFEKALQPGLQANVRRLRKPLAIHMGKLPNERQQGDIRQARMIGQQVIAILQATLPASAKTPRPQPDKPPSAARDNARHTCSDSNAP